MLPAQQRVRPVAARLRLGQSKRLLVNAYLVPRYPGLGRGSVFKGIDMRLAKPETLREGDKICIFLGADYKVIDLERAERLVAHLQQHIRDIKADANLARLRDGTGNSRSDGS